MSRAQAALEFLSMVSILGFILILFSVVSFQKQNEVFDQKVWVGGWSVCEIVSSEINSAVSAGDGYSHSFVLPSLLAEIRDYDVKIFPLAARVLASWSSGSCQIPVLSVNYSSNDGSFAFDGDGNLLLGQGKLIVENDGGVIDFSKVS